MIEDGNMQMCKCAKEQMDALAWYHEVIKTPGVQGQRVRGGYLPRKSRQLRKEIAEIKRARGGG